MNVLVTGGAGFIGSHLVDRFIELGHQVTVVDDFSTGKKENLNPKAELINYDVSQLYYITKCEYIFHLAALPSVPYSVEHPTITHKVNVNGTYNILKAARDSKVKKVIFVSSSAVYGDQELPLREVMVPKPKSPYALHKWMGEQYMKLFNELYGLPTISLRFFNIYGPRGADPMTKFLRLKKEEKPLTIYGDGKQSRDFVYVDDTVEACILAMEKPIENDIVNICTNQNITINEIADLIGGKREYLPARKGDVLHTLGTNMKAETFLGWRPKIDIKKGLKLMEE